MEAVPWPGEFHFLLPCLARPRDSPLGEMVQGHLAEQKRVAQAGTKSFQSAQCWRDHAENPFEMDRSSVRMEAARFRPLSARIANWSPAARVTN